MPNPLEPHFDDVQAHYDLSDDFFRLFLDPTRTYSCAYFEREDMTLQEAQLAKIDLTLSKLSLKPGMTLLDIGCGWGATMRRAVERYDVNVIGLTLSKNQAAHVQRMFDETDSSRSRRVLLQGWEQFDEPVDRIVSIGAFEHFGRDRYDDFFKKVFQILPDDGVMQAIAAEVGYCETAFLTPSGTGAPGEYRVRYFSPLAEERFESCERRRGRAANG